MGEPMHTPGPWAWFGNARNREIYLATNHSGRRYVMGFHRWGMKGAQPMFQPAERGLVPAADLLQFEVGDRDVVGLEAAKQNDSVYRLDICGIDCADARLIETAPELLEALELVNEHYGEDMVVMMPVQIRRVRGEQEQVPSTENPLSRRGQLFGAVPAAQEAAE